MFGFWARVAGLNRGKAALEFEGSEMAEKAVKCMDGGQLDGSFLTVQVGTTFHSISLTVFVLISTYQYLHHDP